MRIHIQYFATLREQRGLSRETLETQSLTVAALFDELHAAHRFSLGQERLRVVLNEQFAPWSAPLSEDDEVVFIPPVAGG